MVRGSISHVEQNFPHSRKHGMVIPPEKGRSMKHFKKIMVMVIAMAMVLSMMSIGTVFAETPNGLTADATITITGLDDDDTVNFLLATSGLNVSDCLFSLIAIYIIGNPRSGIAVYMSYLIFEMSVNHLAIFIFASLIAVSVSLVLSLKLGDSFSRLMGGVDYRKLSIGVILLQVIILYVFIFYYKAPVFYMTLALVTSIAMGMLPHYIGIGKSHLMGVLIIPAIVIYFQMFI